MPEPIDQPGAVPPAGPAGANRPAPNDTLTHDPAATRPPDEADLPDLAPPEAPGELGRLGGYRVVKLLGEGGMGAVYAAEDVALRRPVALKTMKPDLARKEGARVRFMREARAAAAVESDHIVRIYQVGEDRGVPFIAMEFLRGKPLDAWMNDNAANLAQLLKIGYETALGLAAAHDKGLVHRDIKPANLWLEAPHGRIKILDFGLARSAQDDGLLTGSGVVVGTPAYMAPEQARGDAVDHRCDLFSLGCVLYHLATGRRPFTGANMLAILSSLAMDVPAPPHEVNPGIPPALSALVLRLLAKRPEDRPASAHEAAEELRRINKGEHAAPADAPVVYAPPAAAGPATVWEEVAVSGATHEVVAMAKPVRRAWPVYAALAGVVVVFVGLAVAGWRVMTGPAADTKPGDGPAQLAKGGEPKGGAPKEPGKTPPRKKDDPPAEMIVPGPALKPEKVWTLDHLDAKGIPAAERFAWQPKELVAVLGTHRRQGLNNAKGLWMTPDGKSVAWGTTRLDLATLKETVGALPASGPFSPDGKRVADGETVWNLADKAQAPVKYNLSGSHIYQFVTDRIVLARDSNTGKDALVWLLDEKEAKPLAKLTDSRAVGSPDGKLIAVAPRVEDAALELHEVSEAGVKLKHTLPGPEGKVRKDGEHFGPQMAFSSSGRLALAGSDKGSSIQLWNLTPGGPKLHATVPGGDVGGPWYSVQISARGDRIARRNQVGVELWAMEGDKPRHVGGTSGIGTVAGFYGTSHFTPDGNGLVCGDSNTGSGAVRVWSVEKEVLVERDPIKPQPTFGGSPIHTCRPMCLSPDGRTLALAAEDDITTVWDLATLTPHRPGPGSDPAEHKLSYPAAYTGDGRSLLVMLYNNSRTSLWQVSPPGPPRPVGRFQMPLPNGASVAAISPDGRHLFRTDGLGVELWDTSGEPPMLRQSIPNDDGGGRAPQFTPDGRYALASVNSDNRYPRALVTWAVTTKGLVERDRVDLRMNAYAISPDGKTVAVGTERLDLYDLAEGKLKARTSLNIPARALSFSPDGKTLAAGDQAVKLIDVESGRVTREFSYPEVRSGTVVCEQLAYHPDGRHLFVVNANHTVYILRLAAPQPAP